MKIAPENKPYLFFLVSMLLALPAFLINLGLSPVIDDEAIRALVAFEMIQKSDFITPTIGGEIYLKKPPLFNWLIAASFNTFRSYGEIPVRIPMIISLFFYSFLIFYFFRKEIGKEHGILSALMFLTCGRIIIYESLHGLIDISFSMLTFLFFMMIYRSFNQGKILKLFLWAYGITAIAFLLKGLPSVVFLVISLLVLFIWQKKFRFLLHWRHFAGIGLFVIIIGAYYLTYFIANDVEPADMVNVLIGETTRRTAIRFGIWKTILHLFTFPFEMLYHFLPWSLLVVFLFRKDLFKKIRSNLFITYISLILIFNILVYWSSPEVYPRYILMLVPLLFGIALWFYIDQKKEGSGLVKTFEIVLGSLITLMIPAPLIIFFTGMKDLIPGVMIYAPLLSIVLMVVAIYFWKKPQLRLYWVVIALLLLRIGFDLFVLPVRHSGSDESNAKKLAEEIVKKTKDSDLCFWWNPELEATGYYGRQITTYRFNYYLNIKKEEVVQITSDRDKDTYYISQYWAVKDENINELMRFQPPGHNSPLVLYKFR
ncbi:MAG: glycosyltransferase family 39 protein [Bacteroidales bacterium]|nr:glycosyltransferase family 39 protein [Bacteroidales bacterium]